ncbi:MAG: exported protein of unknown function [Myxococcaceae bacterium]|nr:exported protein of unknown function [Myxococcaceae bacterium]
MKNIVSRPVLTFLALLWLAFPTSSAHAQLLSATTTLPAPPQYKGTSNGSMNMVNGAPACTQLFQTKGYVPDIAGHETDRYPLFIYLNGSELFAPTNYDAPAPTAVAKAMASRGFVALNPQYDNTYFNPGSDDKAKCLFSTFQAGNLLANACQHPRVDCSKGVVVWGHSQGAQLAIKAANFAFTLDGKRLIRGVWAAGFGAASFKVDLPRDRLRVVNGAQDLGNNDVTTLNATTQLSCASNAQSCYRPNKSGWALVSFLWNTIGSDHCWFGGCSAAAGSAPLASGFSEGGNGEAWRLGVNADWLASTIRSSWQ